MEVARVLMKMTRKYLNFYHRGIFLEIFEYKGSNPCAAIYERGLKILVSPVQIRFLTFNQIRQKALSLCDSGLCLERDDPLG